MDFKNTEAQNVVHTPDCEEPIPDTLRMIPTEDAARATLHGVACNLGRDEVRVLTRIAERLRAGRLVYGPLTLAQRRALVPEARRLARELEWTPSCTSRAPGSRPGYEAQEVA